MLNISFLQSQEWFNFQKSLGKDFFEINIDNIQSIYQRNNFPLGFNYFYFPRGPIFKNKISELELNNFINLFKQGTRPLNKSISLKIEPNENYSKELESLLLNSGFKKIKSIQPEETILINLEKTEEELLREMEHDTRYAIRYANRQGVVILKSITLESKERSFEDFWRIFKETNHKHNLRAYEKPYYEKIYNLEGKL